jgi:hypothetical protein
MGIGSRSRPQRFVARVLLSLARMKPKTGLGWLGVVVLAVGGGCMDLDAPTSEGVARTESPILHGPCDDQNSPLLCGWENGAADWFNLYQKSPQSDWLNNASAAPVLAGWEKPWTNDWEGTGTNSYVIGWSRVWSAAWSNWDFSGARFAWAMNRFKPDRFVGNGCAHPTTQTGGPLSSSCNGVVAAVCAQQPLCCGMQRLPRLENALVGSIVIHPPLGSWDSSCVNLAVSLAETGGGDHSTMDTGVSLPAYDRPRPPVVLQPLNKLGNINSNIGGIGGIDWGTEHANLCARKVCSNSSLAYCCTGQWDEACVAEAFNSCSARYTANTHVEVEPETNQARVFTDVCYEATEPGFNACPIARTSINGGQECCRRALVLRGIYRAVDTTSAYAPSDTAHYGRGRILDWVLEDNVRLNRALVGPVYNVTSTIAIGNCYTPRGGPADHSGDVCETRKHKLWQAAGPGGPLYPDVPETSVTNNIVPSSCSGNPKAVFERCTDWTHQFLGYRDLLLATVSALITTDAPHDIDIQWRPDIYFDSQHNPVEVSEHTVDPYVDQVSMNFPALAYADLSTWEGNWGTAYDSGHLTTFASCYGPNAPQRAHGDLVSNVATCDPEHPVGRIQTFFNVPSVLAQQ